MQSALRAVTYNILADAYVHAERYPHSPAEALEPRARRRRLLATVEELRADLYCLQEVEAEAHAEIAASLGDAFDSALAIRPGRPDGCATFWRREVLGVEGHDTLHYRASDGGGSQLAVITRFQLGRERLVVANTHLRWESGQTSPDAHIGRRQLLELLDWRERELPSEAWIIAGDFNTLSDGVVVRAALERGFELGCRKQRPWDTTNINGRCRKIDYLLYTTAHLQPEPGRLARLERRTIMPSLEHASDHLPVVVDFEWVSFRPAGSS